MTPSDELRYEHEVLRAKLALLQEWVPYFCVTPFTLRRFVTDLADCLRAHTEKEESYLAILRHAVEAPSQALLEHLHDDHLNHRTRLAILHDLVSRDNSQSEEQLLVQAGTLIRELREHMATEEAGFFPLIDRQGEPLEVHPVAREAELVERGLA